MKRARSPWSHIAPLPCLQQSRIDSHASYKEFWDWAAVFVSNSGGLNRAHVTWLEHSLVKRAEEANRCRLDNANIPQEPVLSEAEKAGTQGFLRELLQIIPLVGLRAFGFPKAVATPQAPDSSHTMKSLSTKSDTIVVPDKEDGFKRSILGRGLVVRHTNLRRNAQQDKIHCCIPEPTRIGNHLLCACLPHRTVWRWW